MQLKAGADITVQCSMCGSPLAIFKVTDPTMIDIVTKEVFKSKVKVRCYKCGDSSFVHEIPGRFQTSGYHIIKRDDPDNVYAKTRIEYVGITEGIVTFQAEEIK